jgi:hypothetical protein
MFGMGRLFPLDEIMGSVLRYIRQSERKQLYQPLASPVMFMSQSRALAAPLRKKAM